MPSTTPGTGLYNSVDQHRPDEVFNIPANTFLSKPNLLN